MPTPEWYENPFQHFKGFQNANKSGDKMRGSWQILSYLGMFSNKNLDLFLIAFPSYQLTLTHLDLTLLLVG